MEIYNYNFVGYAAYEDIAKKAFDQINKSMNKNFYFEIAANEAVLNAAKYSIFGLNDAEISMTVLISDTDVSVIIKSITQPFSAEHYREQLYQLLDNPATMDMKWGEYTGMTERSRGFWYMLTACEYIIVNNDGNEITICIRKSANNNEIPDPDTQIRRLLPRFLIKKNGVVQ
ncbi:hypothetical protein [Pectinatus frisingensis]|uniref:hypothetical protein n=1 Tax=Pectinatus frisingensis TaxID=865 RepID=UPI0018C856D1|nr:hypothetical protein [Pectinatus frisingensis]